MSIISQMNSVSLNHSISNMPFDESIEFCNSDYISLETVDELKECVRLEREDIDAYDKVFYCLPPIPHTKEEDAKWRNFREANLKFKDKIGDGNMEYIKNPTTRAMCTNAWKAITFSNNWDFVAQDIDSFMFSNDPRIDEITEKMIELGYDGHSGSSFGNTMRNMQYLVRNGEDEFKKIFDENTKKALTKFLDYSGGF